MSGATTYERRTARQWVILATGVVVLTALCLIAARWQWHRYVSREAEIKQIETSYSAPAEPLDSFVSRAGATLADRDVWRPATITGHYEPDKTVLLRNRPISGSPGFHVLVPFVVDSPSVVIIVDRGFISSGGDPSTPVAYPAPPTGHVTATVTLRQDEPASDKSAPARQVHRINANQVLAAGSGGGNWARGKTVGAYGQVRTESPAAAGVLTPLDPPDTDPGSHLSYTFQWCVFALGALGGFFVLLRRDRRERRGDAVLVAGDLMPGDRGARGGTRTKRPTDSEEEDALIDAQLDGRRFEDVVGAFGPIDAPPGAR